MKKLMKIFFLIVLSLFLISCGQNIPAETQDGSIKIANGSADTIAPTACTAHWECFDDEYKVYQLENCTRTQTTKCERGCVNGTCRAAPVCAVGFKCIDENRYGYQKEDCSFINKRTCAGGCVDNKCLEAAGNLTDTSNTTAPAQAPANSYAQENQEDNSTEAAATIHTLQLGEEQEIESGGQMHIVKIYNIEADRAIISVDGERSDWMYSGDTFSYSNLGVTFRMEAIMFQTYGVKAIDYSYG